MAKPTRIVIMGVSGCGKSSVGEALATAIGDRYIDGDDMHLPASIAKMQAGKPLEDSDRWPWLDRIGETLAMAGNTTIVGCSALKRIYRDRIRKDAGGGVLFVHLSGPKEVIAQRMKARPGHLMPASLVDSQFATLEPPTADEASVTVAINQPLAAVVSMVTASIAALDP
ncbi:gluconokinase [Pararhizobium gei]|uniref:gluconokinase n=1 Tax=Pararhizobium gei TaxID=1395951 RepID=UPI0023D98447|nr:gluconokinase [Rhizobium gei]